MNYNVELFSVGDLTNFHRGIKINTLDVFDNEIGVVVFGYTSIHRMNDVGVVILAMINDFFSKRWCAFTSSPQSLSSNLMATGRCKES